MRRAMTAQHLTALIVLFIAGCGPDLAGPTSTGGLDGIAGDGVLDPEVDTDTDGNDDDTGDDTGSDVEPLPDLPEDEWFAVEGEVWGPCPTNSMGVPTLCNSEDLACVPADAATANTCLPLECPDSTPAFALYFETGWGHACYPRCEADADCLVGQVCGAAVADGGSMCAWPVD